MTSRSESNTPTYTGSSTPSSYSLYDADGTRETKAAAVFWDYGYLPDGTLIEESNAIGQLTNYIYLDGKPIALYGLVTTLGVTVETTYYVHADHLGTPQYVTNPSQVVEWKDVYQPFGLDSPTSLGNVNQSLRFPGMYFDSETGLYYNNQRYYDTSSGRYIQSDPIGLISGANVYAYVSDNPFKWIDPRGLAAQSQQYPNIYISPINPKEVENIIGDMGDTLDLAHLAGVTKDIPGISCAYTLLKLKDFMSSPSEETFGELVNSAITAASPEVSVAEILWGIFSHLPMGPPSVDLSGPYTLLPTRQFPTYWPTTIPIGPNY
jgi:RHS repeat-associated protein